MFEPLTGRHHKLTPVQSILVESLVREVHLVLWGYTPDSEVVLELF